MADRSTPFIGRSHDRLTAMINAQNQTNLVEGVDFTYGPPQPTSGPGDRNTQITFNPVNFLSYAPETLRYRRRDLAALGTLPDGSVLPVTIPSVPFTTASLLGAINTALGLNLEVTEILNETFTTYLPTYPITIKDDTVSLAWVASTFNFTAYHPNARLLEDGTPRLLENGQVRMLETA